MLGFHTIIRTRALEFTLEDDFSICKKQRNFDFCVLAKNPRRKMDMDVIGSIHHMIDPSQTLSEHPPGDATELDEPNDRCHDSYRELNDSNDGFRGSDTGSPPLVTLALLFHPQHHFLKLLLLHQSNQNGIC
jgi:hypothetical protein